MAHTKNQPSASTPRPRRRCPLRDFGRVLGPEPLSHLGNLMVRQPQYFRGLFILLMGYAWNNQNSQGAIVSGVAMVGTRVIGMALKFGPSLFLNRLKQTARNAGLIFNIAQKRQAFERYHHIVWDYVFEPESRLYFGAAERRRQWKREQALDKALLEGISELPPWVRHELRCAKDGADAIAEAMKQAQPVSAGIEKTREGFLISFQHALQRDYDRATQTRVTGLEINAIEDFLRTPILGEKDFFPRINYQANRRLNDAQRRAAAFVAFTSEGTPRRSRTFTGRHGFFASKRHGIMRNLWHAMVTNVIVKRTGTAIRKLSRCYPDLEINAQTILWAGREQDAWIIDHEGLTEAIVSVRQQMLDQAFGDTSERTEVMLERLTRWDELQAMELRATLDPQYCNPDEAINIFRDYKRLGDYGSWLQDIAARMRLACGARTAFRQWLQGERLQWAEQLQRSRQAIQRYMGTHGLLIEKTVREKCPEHLAELPHLLERLEARLCDEDELGSNGFPPWLIEACNTCEAELANSTGDLFATINALRLRAVEMAFHANENGMRETFVALHDTTPSHETRSVAIHRLHSIIADALSQSATYTDELREVRLHHAICRAQTAIYQEFIDGLRDVSVRPARRRLRKLIERVRRRARPTLDRNSTLCAAAR